MTTVSWKTEIWNNISTHILTKRMTEMEIWLTSLDLIFQLTSSRRGWRLRRRYRITGWYFNSHPHEEDDGFFYINLHPCVISTHILTKRMTMIDSTIQLLLRYFNSHPHEEDDRIQHNHIWRNIISTHILTKRMTHVTVKGFKSGLFQLTSSRRGWLRHQNSQTEPNIFQLTSSRRGWRHRLMRIWTDMNISTHILTKRMTAVLRAHIIAETISTHILTKRMTSRECWHCRIDYISTHILTKRMTADDWIRQRSEAFQLTSSRRGWRLCTETRETSLWIFQLTSSRRGWRNPLISDKELCDISTHILTKRMTAILNKNNLFKIAYYINNKHFISIVDIFFHFHIYF